MYFRLLCLTMDFTVGEANRIAGDAELARRVPRYSISEALT